LLWVALYLIVVHIPVSNADARDSDVNGGSLLDFHGLRGRLKLVFFGHWTQKVLARALYKTKQNKRNTIYNT
jgi:hypothetical protein